MWYHPTAQVPLSHQIQSSDASGVPQVHLNAVSSSSGDGGFEEGVFGSGGEGGEVCCVTEACGVVDMMVEILAFSGLR